MDNKNSSVPVYIEALKAKILKINFKDESLEMSFVPSSDYCHSNGTIIQGGFITTMLDCSMAFLVMQMTDFKKTPMSIDINVNFMSAGKPGLTIARSKIIKLGNSIGFLSAELFQDNNLIATASSSIKLAAFPGIDFIKNNIGSDAEIIYK